MSAPDGGAGQYVVYLDPKNAGSSATELTYELYFCDRQRSIGTPTVTLSKTDYPQPKKDPPQGAPPRPKPPKPTPPKPKLSTTKPTMVAVERHKSHTIWRCEFTADAAPGTLQVKITIQVPSPYNPKKGVPTLVRCDPFRLGIEPGSMNTERPIALKVPDNPPRLSLAINTTYVEPAEPEDFEPDSPADGSRLLEHIWSRLLEGLAGAWLGPDGQYGLKTLDELQPGDFGRKDDPAAAERCELYVREERWARGVTEILMCVPYGGPGLHYFDSHAADAEIFDRVQDGADPVTPLVCACQHLAQMGVLLRGRYFEYFRLVKERITTRDKNAVATEEAPRYIRIRSATWPINAGSMSALTTQRVGGRWFLEPDKPVHFSSAVDPDKEGYQNIPLNGFTGKLHAKPALTKAAVALQLKSPDGLIFGPGAIYVQSNRPQTEIKATAVFDTEKQTCEAQNVHIEYIKDPKTGEVVLDPDNREGAHVAFVLRVDRDLKRIQLFDTGGYGGFDRTVGVTLGKTGNYDDPWRETVTPAPFRGIGIFENRDPLLAHSMVGKMRLARPLGLARVCVVKRSAFTNAELSQLSLPKQAPLEDWLLYASPLLRMYHSQPFHPEDDRAAGLKAGQNYHISRFLWALREIPGKTVVGVVVMVFVPRKALAEAMLEQDARGRSLPELVVRARELAIQRAAKKGLTEEQSAKNLANKYKTGPEFLTNHLSAIADLASHPSGEVRVLFSLDRGKKTMLHNLRPHSNLPTAAEVPWDKAFRGERIVVPDYFSGDWGDEWQAEWEQWRQGLLGRSP